MLFVTNEVLGWRTNASTLERVTASREDLEAVHLRLRQPRRKLPPLFSGAAPHVGMVRSWEQRLGVILDGPLALKDFDVVHAAPHFVALAVAKRALGWRGRLSIHLDATLAQAKAQRKGIALVDLPQRHRFLVDAERLIVESTDLIWAMSHWAKEGVEREYGAAAGDVRLLPPVTPVTPVTPKDWSKLDGNRPVKVAFVANEFERKGGDRLLRWHQQHWATTAELHMFGAAPRPRPDLPGVTWHGQTANDQLVHVWLPQMDMLVLPTRSDMSPYAVAEAVSAGLPAIASNLGGLADLIVDGKTGYLVAMDDEERFIEVIGELISDPKQREKMGAAALAHSDASLDPTAVLTSLLDTLVDLGR